MEQELYLNRTNDWWTREFAKRMNKSEYGTEEYEKCRKIFSFLANRNRLWDRVNVEAIKD